MPGTASIGQIVPASPLSVAGLGLIRSCAAHVKIILAFSFGLWYNGCVSIRSALPWHGATWCAVFVLWEGEALKHPNWDYMEQRLEDPKLLERAVPIVSGGIVVDIAVPVGGKRRGGYVVLPSMRACREAYRQLTGKPGFPNLRI